MKKQIPNGNPADVAVNRKIVVSVGQLIKLTKDANLTHRVIHTLRAIPTINVAQAILMAEYEINMAAQVSIPDNSSSIDDLRTAAARQKELENHDYSLPNPP